MTTYRQQLQADVLYHDGRKGMHWGIRKYRNYDGTLTPAGRERYGVGPARSGGADAPKKLTRAQRKAQKEIARKSSAKAAEKKAKAAAEEARREREALEAERAKQQSEEKIQNKRQATAEGNAQMKLDNEALAYQINRLKLEREYQSLMHPAKKPLLDRVIDYSEKAKKIAGIGKDIKELVNAIGGVKKPKSILDLEKEDSARLKMEENARKRKAWKEGTEKSLDEQQKEDTARFIMETHARARAGWAKEDAKAQANKDAEAAKEAKKQAARDEAEELWWAKYQQERKANRQSSSQPAPSKQSSADASGTDDRSVREEIYNAFRTVPVNDSPGVSKVTVRRVYNTVKDVPVSQVTNPTPARRERYNDWWNKYGQYAPRG